MRIGKIGTGVFVHFFEKMDKFTKKNSNCLHYDKIRNIYYMKQNEIEME